LDYFLDARQSTIRKKGDGSTLDQCKELLGDRIQRVYYRQIYPPFVRQVHCISRLSDSYKEHAMVVAVISLICVKV
jgi:hypothetical protein